MKMHRALEAYLQASVSSALDGDALVHLLQKKWTPDTHWIGCWTDSRATLKSPAKSKFFAATGNQTGTLIPQSL
jgi:hypothetical protein